MGTKITFNPFSQKSIQDAQRQLKAYRDGLIEKCTLFVQKLSEAGIETAEQNVGGFGKYIVFQTELNPDKYGCKGVMVASNTGIIKSEWRISEDGDTRTADVSPILMAEFGAGLKANNPRAGEFGMGTGTFPDQTHAEDPDGWWYQDLDEVWHHSYGVAPTMPMTQAASEMFRRVSEIAKEVFGT